jgi:hypothetical protein
MQIVRLKRKEVSTWLIVRSIKKLIRKEESNKTSLEAPQDSVSFLVVREAARARTGWWRQSNRSVAARKNQGRRRQGCRDPRRMEEKQTRPKKVVQNYCVCRGRFRTD